MMLLPAGAFATVVMARLAGLLGAVV